MLLLHRVQTSSSFASAHVFPGGNLSQEQDGDVPAVNNPQRHEDSPVYRLGAIRECFEECGILLAKRKDGAGLLEVGDEERIKARKAVHANTVKFSDWVERQGGVVDTGLSCLTTMRRKHADETESLLPFTRWITPPRVKRRFTTAMYIYFLPLPSTASDTLKVKDAVIPVPTSDGGIEHTAATFLPPSAWLTRARDGLVDLFPPQYFLLHLLAPFFSPENVPSVISPEVLKQQRDAFLDFYHTGHPPWARRCICPVVLSWNKDNGTTILGLDKPGPELDGTGRRGDAERVVVATTRQGGPRKLEVRWRAAVMQEAREVQARQAKI